MKLFDALEEKDKELEKKIAEIAEIAEINKVVAVPDLMDHNEQLFRAIAADINAYFEGDEFKSSSSIQDEDRIVSIVRKHLFR